MRATLIEAVLCGDAAGVRNLLAQGADPESSDADSTALCHACFGGHKKIVGALVKAGADPGRADGRGFVPLHLAVSRDHAPVVTLLLKAGVDPDARGKEDGTALHVAAAQGSSKAARALLKSGADLHALDAHGAPPLAYAAMHGRVKLLKALLKAGAAEDLADKAGRTPLWHALDGAGRLRQDFWEAPGTRNGKDIYFVVRCGQFLIREGGREFEPYPAKVGREISEQVNPAHLQYLDAVSGADALIRTGAEVHAADASGWTVLHAAMALGEHRLVSKLLKAGADGHARDERGVRPTHAAAGSGREELFDRCRTRFKKLDFTLADQQGLLPFHHAVKSGSLPIARALSRNVDLTNPSATQLARDHGHTAIADHFEPGESAARKRLGEPRLLPIETALKHLEGGGFFPQMPNSHRKPKEGKTYFVAVVEDYWVQAFAAQDGSIGVDELELRPVAELRTEFEVRAFDGRVRVLPKPASELPNATLDAVRTHVRGTNQAMAALGSGRWLRVGDDAVVVEWGDDLLRLEYGSGRLTGVRPSPQAALGWCTKSRTTLEPEPGVLNQLKEVAQRARKLRADCAAGKGALLASAVGEARTIHAAVAGKIVGLSFDKGALRRATIALRGDQLTAALWARALAADPLEAIPKLPEPWAEALEAAVRRDVDSMMACAAAGVADYHGTGPRGGWKLRDERLNNDPADRSQVAQRVQTGEVRTMLPKEPPTVAPAQDDSALAEIARGASPVDLMAAAQRAGTQTHWRGSGWEVSIVRYVLVYFDGSQKTQTFADFLADGPSFDLPPETGAEVRDAVRACVQAL